MSGTAKMLVSADGARTGTVGGGCLEAEITERAYDVIERRVPAITEHTLNAELAGDYGLTCGGTAVMFIEPVYPDPVLRGAYEACVQLLGLGERGVMATAVNWESGAGKTLLWDGEYYGSTDPRLCAAANTFAPAREEQGIDSTVFIEPVVGAARLVVFGGGHVGASVAQAAAFAGWRVTVVDDRVEYADEARFPFAEQTMVCDYHAIPVSLLLDSSTYVVVATRGHQHDALVVEQLAGKTLRYLGMLGSRRKVALTWKMLEGQGVPGDVLRRIHAPIGLSIGADTPQEIAIAVVAEMISVRRSGSRRRGGVAVSQRPAAAGREGGGGS
jgi:xanthine dehydrogenase accessory factor